MSTSTGDKMLGRVFDRASTTAVVKATAAFLLVTLVSFPARAQTFSVLHAFTNGADGSNPLAGLSLDSAGNLYGTTEQGGQHSSFCGSGCGVVFRLAKRNGAWLFAPLYAFHGSDGRYPNGPVTIGADGSLYGTAYLGGPYDLGVVFRLQPPLNACESTLCSWRESVIHTFSDVCPPCDGIAPSGQLTLDPLGAVYGTTFEGGEFGEGTVYQLTRTNGVWTEAVLHSFAFPDGAFPFAGVIFDNDANLYGTTMEGGAQNKGAVFQLKASGNHWVENVVHNFVSNDGSLIQAGLIRDADGSLYGAASSGGANGLGTVFELISSGDSWNFSLLYSLAPQLANQPFGTLAMDAARNLYGAGRVGGRFGFGEIFKLTPFEGMWTYHTLYSFTGGNDGAYPYGNVALDTNGNLYGTTEAGGGICGGLGCGVVWTVSAN